MTSALSLRRVALACAPLLVLLAACGSSSAASNKVATLTTGDVTGGAATTTTISAKETQDKILAYAACMRQNGVDMKDPTFDANGNMTGGGLGANSGVDRRSTAFQTAQKACGSLIEGVNLFGNRRGNFDPTALQTAFNDFTACLRSNDTNTSRAAFLAAVSCVPPCAAAAIAVANVVFAAVMSPSSTSGVG